MSLALKHSTPASIKSTCEACHVSGGAAIAAVQENCRQLASNWCLERVNEDTQACPNGCGAVEPRCRSGNFRETGTPDPHPQPPRGPGEPTPRPAAATAQNPAAAQNQPATTPSGNQNADQQTCDRAAQRASQCCNNPASCMTGSTVQPGPAPGQGINEYCQQLRAAGAMGGQENNTASGVCYQAYSNCVNSCEGMANGHSGQVAQTMRATANACRGYQSQVSQLASQGLNSQVQGSSGDICNNVSQAAPQNFGGLGGMGGNPNSANRNSLPESPGNSNPNDPYGCAADPSSAACQQCSANPNTPACRALAYEKEVRGEATFGASDSQANEKPTGSDFNLQDSVPDGTGPGLTTGAVEQTPVTTATIANNSGGVIPGGVGGAPAALGGGPGGGRSSPGSPGYTTDVLQGLSSPSGYSQSAEPNQDGAEGGFQGYGNNARAPASEHNGVDLRRFLPGGDKDPMRRGPAGLDINSAQINGRFVNIWNRISDRMQEKCRLGELIGCER